MSYAEDKPVVLDEILVSAVRTPLPESRTASSLTLFDAADIESSGQSKVSDLIRESPGVDVVQSGGPGGNAAAFIRGANSEHTLVLLDGIELNNPINPTRAFNFSNLSLNNIERVEVLRGPQSMLYGSDAMGGVINLSTHRGQGPASFSGGLEAGSYGSFSQRAGVSGGSSGGDYSLSLFREDVGGFSAADSSFGNTEKDGYTTTDFTSSFGRKLSDGEIRGLVRYVDSAADRDVSGGPGGDDPNNRIYGQDLFARLQGSVYGLSKNLKHTLGASYSQENYQDYNYADPARPLDTLNSKYFGKLLKLDWQSTYNLGASTFLLGLESQEERGASTLHSESAYGPYDSDFSEKSLRADSIYAHSVLAAADNMDLTGGIRLDHHEEAGDRFTYRIGPVFRPLEGLKVYGTLGTGFKAPSLYELYSEYGSKDLKPEKSLAMDAGLEKSLLSEKVVVGAAFFSNRYTDLISFDPGTYLFSNIAKARADGVESKLEYHAGPLSVFGADLTFTNTKDESTDQSLLRRARVKTGVFARTNLSQRLKVSARFDYIGRRADNNYEVYPPTREILGGYTIVSLRLAREINDRVELVLRGENIFDRNYAEVYGFGTQGASVFGGVNVKL